MCSTDAFFKTEVAKLKSMFVANGYPMVFFEKVYNRFINSLNDSTGNTINQSRRFVIAIPYIGKESRRFVSRLVKVVRSRIDVNVLPVYKSFKIRNYFQLKSHTPSFLCSNVVYKFSCSCDMNKTYIGMSSRHLGTRVKEHLNFKSLHKSSIKDHIMDCKICSNSKHSFENFNVLRRCKSDYMTKIHEALLIKKHAPCLNRQLFANGSSFLLQVFG